MKNKWIYNECAHVTPDLDRSYGEERFIIMGLSTKHNALVVCHCYRGDNEMIRIILDRKAEKRERKQYEEFRYA
ncbi:BrnT family toxin [Photobacterium carnosum]|uniref:BrnT family toxin n=1 Tax=Photobacterium carnosum TaxID=2023717 RepID=UPI002F26B885|nr:hypothetical protein [Photobacterium carnosum]